MEESIKIERIDVPIDKHMYPSWEWPDKCSQLLFDHGYSYGILREAETVLDALCLVLGQPDYKEANKELLERLEPLVAKMKNFRKRRLNARDDIYKAGYLAAAKLEANEKGNGETA